MGFLFDLTFLDFEMMSGHSLTVLVDQKIFFELAISISSRNPSPGIKHSRITLEFLILRSIRWIWHHRNAWLLIGELLQQFDLAVSWGLILGLLLIRIAHIFQLSEWQIDLSSLLNSASFHVDNLSFPIPPKLLNLNGAWLEVSVRHLAQTLLPLVW